MKFSILTLFPELFSVFLETSIIKRAVDANLISFQVYNLLQTVPIKVRVDAHSVGPGPGMVIKPEVIEKAVFDCEQSFGPATKIFLTPQGTRLTQKVLRTIFAKLHKQSNPTISDPTNNVEFIEIEKQNSHIILICSRYEGVDQRTEEYFADISLSIGDYVLMGGELPAQVFLEGLVRLIPGVVGNDDSLLTESFETPMLDHPSYCKPDIWKGKQIPAVLLSGNHEEIRKWRLSQAAKKTLFQRFDWFRQHKQALTFTTLAQQIIPSHYCVIMHDGVLNKEGLTGTTSIKSIDLHDISRAAISFGFKKFFVVQPLMDQQEIVREFFSFWTEGQGEAYNQTRCEAIEKIEICNSLDEVMFKIKALEGKDALLISTSALNHDPGKTITFHDQERIWLQERPVLLIFGTGYGLGEKILAQSNYILTPIKGLSFYNHLSVRAAAAIIFDRWLGINPD